MSESTRLTEDDIRKLPRWPRAAFAVRCARRAQALFREVFPDGEPDYFQSFDKAVTFAEQSCTQAQPVPGLDEAGSEAVRYPTRFGSNASASLPGTPAHRPSDAESLRVDFAEAAVAASRAVCAAATGNDETCTQQTCRAYQQCVSAARNAHAADRESVLRIDYDLLRQATDSGKLTGDSPVWPQFFGLKKEAETYYRELPKLVAEGKNGQFVLIEGDRIVNFFPTWESAVQAGREQFDFGIPFLVKQIEADEKPVSLHY